MNTEIVPRSEIHSNIQIPDEEFEIATTRDYLLFSLKMFPAAMVVPTAMAIVTGSAWFMFASVLFALPAFLYSITTTTYGENMARRKVQRMLKKHGITMTPNEISEFKSAARKDWNYSITGDRSDFKVKAKRIQKDEHGQTIKITYNSLNRFSNAFHEAITLRNPSAVDSFNQKIDPECILLESTAQELVDKIHSVENPLTEYQKNSDGSYYEMTFKNEAKHDFERLVEFYGKEFVLKLDQHA